MHFQLKKTITYVGVLTALLPALSALAADDGKLDPSTAPKRGQYPYDSAGTNVRSGFTQNCVLTGFWSPQEATPECHPDLFAKKGAPPVAAAQSVAPEPAAVEAAAVEPYQAAPYEEPVAQSVAPAVAAASVGAAVAEEASVPEFVSEAEPAGMVPVPSPDSFAAGAADDSISGPIVFYGDDGEGAVKDDDGIIGRNEYYDEDSGAVQDDGIIAHEMYNEDGDRVADDDGIIAHEMYNDEDEGVVKDDGIVAQSRYYDEDESAVKDDDITGRSMYYDEDQTASNDDGITALSQYHDEDEGAAKDDDIIAHNVYGDDDSGRNPENLVSEPKAFEDKLAQAEEPKAAPVTMLPVTITVEADPLFDFDKYSVRADSRKKLDDLVQQLKSVSYGEIIVVGFADPIGSSMYNQKLSERRAASVKRYLEGKGVPAGKIRNEGRGETEEYASYQSCGGLRKAKLISCLQPDRRVEVTVTAQKQQ